MKDFLLKFRTIVLLSSLSVIFLFGLILLGMVTGRLGPAWLYASLNGGEDIEINWLEEPAFAEIKNRYFVGERVGDLRVQETDNYYLMGQYNKDLLKNESLRVSVEKHKVEENELRRLEMLTEKEEIEVPVLIEEVFLEESEEVSSPDDAVNGGGKDPLPPEEYPGEGGNLAEGIFPGEEMEIVEEFLHGEGLMVDEEIVIDDEAILSEEEGQQIDYEEAEAPSMSDELSGDEHFSAPLEQPIDGGEETSVIGRAWKVLAGVFSGNFWSASTAQIMGEGDGPSQPEESGSEVIVEEAAGDETVGEELVSEEVFGNEDPGIEDSFGFGYEQEEVTPEEEHAAAPEEEIEEPVVEEIVDENRTEFLKNETEVLALRERATENLYDVLLSFKKDYSMDIASHGGYGDLHLDFVKRNGYLPIFKRGMVNYVSYDEQEIVSYYYDKSNGVLKEWVVLNEARPNSYQHENVLVDKSLYQVRKTADGEYFVWENNLRDIRPFVFRKPRVVDSSGQDKNHLLQNAYHDGLFTIRFRNQEELKFPLLIEREIVMPAVQVINEQLSLSELDYLTNTPLFFEQNLGQTNEQIDFVANKNRAAYFFRGQEIIGTWFVPYLKMWESKWNSSGLSFQNKIFSDESGAEESELVVDDLVDNFRDGVYYDDFVEEDVSCSSRSGLGAQILNKRDEQFVFAYLRQQFVGANPQTSLRAGERNNIAVNYLLGDDPEVWRQETVAYDNIKIPNLYQGIDLTIHGDSVAYEQEYSLSQGARPEQVQMRFLGSADINLTTEGDLVIDAGVCSFALEKPYAYQLDSGKRNVLSASWTPLSKNNVALQVSNYDGNKDMKVVLRVLEGSSTCLQTIEKEKDVAIVPDTNNDYYLLGHLASPVQFPINSSRYQCVGEEVFDPVLTKVNTGRQRISYQTTFGGSDEDRLETLEVSSVLYGEGGVVETHGDSGRNVDSQKTVSLLGILLGGAQEQIVIGGRTMSKDFPALPLLAGKTDGALGAETFRFGVDERGALYANGHNLFEINQSDLEEAELTVVREVLEEELAEEEVLPRDPIEEEENGVHEDEESEDPSGERELSETAVDVLSEDSSLSGEQVVDQAEEEQVLVETISEEVEEEVTKEFAEEEAVEEELKAAPKTLVELLGTKLSEITINPLLEHYDLTVEQRGDGGYELVFANYETQVKEASLSLDLEVLAERLLVGAEVEYDEGAGIPLEEIAVLLREDQAVLDLSTLGLSLSGDGARVLFGREGTMAPIRNLGSVYLRNINQGAGIYICPGEGLNVLDDVNDSCVGRVVLNSEEIKRGGTDAWQVVLVNVTGEELSYEEARQDILSYYKISAAKNFGAGIFGFIDSAWLDYPAFQAVKKDLIAAYRSNKQMATEPVLLAETADDFVQGTIDEEELLQQGAVLGDRTVELLSGEDWLKSAVSDEEAEAVVQEGHYNGLTPDEALLLDELEEAEILAVADSEALAANALGELIVKIGKNYGVVRYEGTQATLSLRPLSRDSYQASFEYGVLNLMNIDNNNEILAYYYDNEQKTSKEWIVLAQRPEERYECRWLLENPEAYQVERKEDGSYLVFSKEFPGVVFYIPQVYFIDAFGKQNTRQVAMEYVDGVFVLRLLEQENIAFPIVIDPSVRMFEGGTRLSLNDDLTVNFSELPPGATVAYRWSVNGEGLMLLNLPVDNNPSVQPDLSGLGNHALMKNGARPEISAVNCVVGACLYFDGQDDYLDSNSLELLSAREGSVELWVKTGSLGSEMSLLRKESVGGDLLVGLALKSDGRLSWSRAGQEIVSASVLTADQWYQVVAIWGPEGLSLSLNGELSVRSTVPAASIAAERALLIAKGYQGYLDELRVYNRALSSEQIKVLFDDGLSGKGGPSRIMPGETKAFEEWDLTVSLLASDGTIGVTVPADNTVRIRNELGLMHLYEPAKEDRNLSAEFEDGAPFSSIVAYQWIQDPFGSQKKLMALNMPGNAGEMIRDLSGNGNDGVYVGQGSLYDESTVRVGGTMKLDGKSYVDVRKKALDLSGAAQGAVSLWLKPEQSCGSLGAKCVLFEYDGDDAGINRLSIYVDNNKQLVFELYNGEKYYLSSTQEVADSKWHHVLANWNSKGMSIFVDAKMDAYNSEAVVLDRHSAGQVTIGAGYTRGETQNYQAFYQGWIDELQVYNRSLSLAQIERLYYDGANLERGDRGAPTEIVKDEHNYNETWSLKVFELTSAGEVGPEVYVGTVTIGKAAATDLTIKNPLQKTGDITFNYSCKNADGRNRDIRVWYTDDAGEPNKALTLKSVSSGTIARNTIANAVCGRQASSNSFVWDSAADGVTVRGPEDSVRVKIEVVNLSIEESAQTDLFSVSNFITVIGESYGPYAGESVLCDGGRLILNGEQSFGDLELLKGCVLTYEAGNLQGTKLKVVGDLTVDTSSSINVDALGCASGKGYESGLRNCVPHNQGRRLGLAAGKDSPQVAAGGAYGGNGGLAGDPANIDGGVSQTGDLLRPAALGSGGGNSNVGAGGAGGGRLSLEVNGELKLDGVISANGGTGQSTAAGRGGGGGSGGSVYISVGELSGEGLIRANGGAAAAIGTSYAGGGGGGRVALYYQKNIFKGEVEAYGGRGGVNLGEPYVGGAGTVYWQDYAGQYGTLIIDNDFFQGQATPLFAKDGEAGYQLESLSVLNGAVLLIDEPGVCSPWSLSVVQGVVLEGGKIENSLFNEKGESCLLEPYEYVNYPETLRIEPVEEGNVARGDKFIEKSTGQLLFVLYPSLQLNGGQIDLSGLNYGTKGGKVFVHVPDDTNLAERHDLYIPKFNFDSGAYVCPEAVNSIDEVNENCPGKVDFSKENILAKDGKKVGRADKVSVQLVNANDDGGELAGDASDYYKVKGLTGSGGAPGDELITVSGYCLVDWGGANCPDGLTVRISANADFNSANTGTTSGGTWTISNVSAQSGDILTVFIETTNEAYEAVAATEISGAIGPQTGMYLIFEHLTIGSDANERVDNTALNIFDNTAASVYGMGDYVFHEVDDVTNVVYVDIQDHDDTFLILPPSPRNTYYMEAALYANNVEVLGRIVMGSYTMYVSGDFTVTGTFSYGTSTVQFTGTEASTISSTQPFYNFACTEPGKTLLFEAGSTTEIKNNLTLQGALGEPILLDSTVDGVQWNIYHKGTESIDYVAVDDAGCDPKSQDLTTTNSVGISNYDICWLVSPDGDPPSGSITYDGGNGAGADFTISTEGANVDVILVGTASDTGSGVMMVEVSIDGGLNWDIAKETGGGDWSTWEYTATLGDGVNQVRIRVTDWSTNQITYTTNSSTTDGLDGAQDITYLFLTLTPVSDYLFGEVPVDTIDALNNTLSIRTNSLTGYQVQVKKQNADPSTTMTGAGQNYPDLVDWDSVSGGNAVTWPSLGVGQKGLGFRIMQTGTDPNAYNSTYWGSDDTSTNAKYAGFPNTYVSVINDANSKSGVTLPLDSELQLQVESEKSVMATTYSGVIEINLIVNP